uniref:Uncharacterized protein n=2 Tax=Cyprinus carpio TaxID=7962 RepID=A0A9J7YWA1_CYPCA
MRVTPARHAPIALHIEIRGGATLRENNTTIITIDIKPNRQPRESEHNAQISHLVWLTVTVINDPPCFLLLGSLNYGSRENRSC